MERRIPWFIGLATAGVVAIVSAYLVSRPAESQVSVPAVEASLPATAPASTPPVVAAPESAANAPQTVAQLIADTASGDATKRATAIAALAEAPRAEALPVLGRILINGEPEVDRPLALRALRDLALNQGDDNGAIREAVRYAIYHGDDFTKVDDVQEVLEIIEESQAR